MEHVEKKRSLLNNVVTENRRGQKHSFTAGTAGVEKDNEIYDLLKLEAVRCDFCMTIAIMAQASTARLK